MRRISTLSGAALALLATPVFAHHGDTPTHWLVEHGLAAGLAAAVVAAAGLFFLMKRKG